MTYKLNRLEKETSIILSILSESKDFSSYAEFDVVDAFISFFKSWIKEKYGEKVASHPFSYLLKKYSLQFINEFDLSKLFGGIDDDFEINRWAAERIVRRLWEDGKINFPTLEKDEKFTEKYKKHLNLFLSEYKIPEWFKFTIEENSPNVVDLLTFVDYPAMLRSQETFNVQTFERELMKYFENYLGVEFGNPIHGEVALNISKPELGNLDYWVKNVLNKKIKKDIKEMPFGNKVHSIKFEPKERNATFKIVFKTNSGYMGRRQFISEIKTYLEGLGYNLHKIRVED